MANIFNDFGQTNNMPTTSPVNDVYAGYAQAMPQLKEMASNMQNLMGQGGKGLNSMVNQMLGGNSEIMQAMQNGNLEQVARKMISEQGLDPDEFMKRVVQPSFNG